MINTIDNQTVYFARKAKDVKIPSKITENAGLDVYAYFEEDEFIFQPHQTRLVPTGLYSACSDDYVLLGRERGSTGSIGMKLGAGVIDSGYRNEIFIAITNDNDKPLVISKLIGKTEIGEDYILYPYSKGIGQLLVVPVPKMNIVELSVEDLKSIPSQRGETRLGQSGK
jgi:dUTP pyrophosphatase